MHAGQPVDMLDLKAERDVIYASLQRAGRRLKLVTDFCTTRRLRSLLTDGCRLLHYSGHGFSYLDRSGRQRARLAFEDGLGGTHALEVEKLTDLVKAGADGDDAGGQSLDFVFVSACHSDQGGEAFVAAGVPHVVAVRREAQLQDKAACAFADQFYFALFKGKTVQQAFNIAKQGVSNDPSILRAEVESDKFLLLPVGGNHNVALCKDVPDGPLDDCSPTPGLCNLPAFFPLQFVGRQADWHQLVTAAVGQEKRVLTLVGASGMGKTSLALATAQYVYERCVFPGGVYYVQAKGAANAVELSAMVQSALEEARTGYAEDEGYAEDGSSEDMEAHVSASSGLPTVLKRLGRCLVLIDHLELPPSNGGTAGIISLLQSALRKAPELRLLFTSSEPVALPGVATRQIVLSPLPGREAARLFKALCPRPISRAEIHCDEPAMLRAELTGLMRDLGPRLPGLDDFQLRSVPDQPLRVQWRLPSLSAAAALHRELSAHSTLLQLDTPPVSASGTAALIGFLSLPKMLARHPALAALRGNPKAISLAVSLLLPDSVTPRHIDEAGDLLKPFLALATVDGASNQHPGEDGGSGGGGGSGATLPPFPPDLPDGCRSILEQLQQTLAPAPPSSPSRASPPPPERIGSNGSASPGPAGVECVCTCACACACTCTCVPLMPTYTRSCTRAHAHLHVQGHVHSACDGPGAVGGPQRPRDHRRAAIAREAPELTRAAKGGVLAHVCRRELTALSRLRLARRRL